MAFNIRALNLNRIAKGVGGLVFGSGEKDEDDGGVESLLELVANGSAADDRRAALLELRDVVTDSWKAQMALGAMGFPILLSVLQEERDDLDMVRAALEAIIASLSAATSSHNEGEEKRGGKEDSQQRLRQGWEGEVARTAVDAGRINAEIFVREAKSVPLLFALLEETDFYIRYHTVQLLTLLLSHCPHRLESSILSVPQGMALLMDMVSEREVIRNEALLLLIGLTRSAAEVQKVVVFEGGFERLFRIIEEEGGPDGGIVVEDCLGLINNLLRNNPSNQSALRETLGLAVIPPLLRLSSSRGDGLSRQKAANLLSALETVSLLLSLPLSCSTLLTSHQTLLAQAGVVNDLVSLALNSYITSAAVRSQSLHVLGKLVWQHGSNQQMLAQASIPTHFLRPASFTSLHTPPLSSAPPPHPPPHHHHYHHHHEHQQQQEPEASIPSLQQILRVALYAPTERESMAADLCIKCFCEGNPMGQSMLASTMAPLPFSTNSHPHLSSSPAALAAAAAAAEVASASSVSPLRKQAAAGSSRQQQQEEEEEEEEEEVQGKGGVLSESFGSVLIAALLLPDEEGRCEASVRAASILEHILADNLECKTRVLSIPLRPSSSHSPPQLLLPHCVRCLMHLAVPATMSLPTAQKTAPYSPAPAYLQPVILRLLITWLRDCPPAVDAFLSPPSHLPFLLDLLSPSSPLALHDSSLFRHISGLAAALLGTCLVFNQTTTLTSASVILDFIIKQVGLSAFFSKWDALRQEPLFSSLRAATSPPTLIPLASDGNAIEGEEDGVKGVEVLVNGRGKRKVAQEEVAVAGASRVLSAVYDAAFVDFISELEGRVRARIVDLFSQPEAAAGGIAAAGTVKDEGESDEEFTQRLKRLVASQAQEIQRLRVQNANLATQIVEKGRAAVAEASAEGEERQRQAQKESDWDDSQQVKQDEIVKDNLVFRAEMEELREKLADSEKDVLVATELISELQAQVNQQKQSVAKLEADLQALSIAYNNLEQENFQLEGERIAQATTDGQEELEKARAEGRAEAREEGETELNDLLVCLGQEERKVEALKTKLMEFGVDVDHVLNNISDNESDENSHDGVVSM